MKEHVRGMMVCFAVLFLTTLVYSAPGYIVADSFDFYATYKCLADTEDLDCRFYHAALSGDGSKLIFGGSDSITGDPLIYTINADGTGLTSITVPSGIDSIGGVAIDDDGSRAFFHDGHLIGDQHFICKVEGGAATKIMDSNDYAALHGVGYIRTTASGDYVYFRNYITSSNADIWRVSQSGGAPEKVIDYTAVLNDGYPSTGIGASYDVSDDGSTIAFTAAGYYKNSTYYYKCELFSWNGSATQLTSEGTPSIACCSDISKSHIAISGDGSTIAFKRPRGISTDWYSIRPDGSDDTLLEEGGINAITPALTYAGTEMFYHDDDANGGALLETDGSGRFDIFPRYNVTRIALTAGEGPRVSISNDGTRVAFIHRYASWPNRQRLYVGYLSDATVSGAPVIESIGFAPSYMPNDDPGAQVIITSPVSDPQGLDDIAITSDDSLLGGLVIKDPTKAAIDLGYGPYDNGVWPDAVADDGIYTTYAWPGDKVDEYSQTIVRIGIEDDDYNVTVADKTISIGAGPVTTPTPIPAPGKAELDFDGDGTSDIGIFRPASGLWAIRGVTRAYFGGADDLIAPGDYNGDGTTDIGIFRTSSGLWAVRGVTRAYFGTSSDLPVSGDYNGDGSADIGIYRSGLWAIRGVTRAYFGGPTDEPVPGYYDGDSSKDIGIFRGGSGLWAITGITRAYFGSSSDDAMPGDYDGDGVWDVGIFRPTSGLWAIRGVTRAYFGSSADDPLTADYTGNGRDDMGIFRGVSGLWAIRGVTRAYFGGSSDIPVVR